MPGTRKIKEKNSYFVKTVSRNSHDHIDTKIIDSAGNILNAVCEVIDIAIMLIGTDESHKNCPEIQLRLYTKFFFSLSAWR